MDHDRAEGEGVAPQEYTAIKIELPGSEWTSAMQKTLKKGSKVPGHFDVNPCFKILEDFDVNLGQNR